MTSRRLVPRLRALGYRISPWSWPPRSAYVLSGAARWSWQHTIPSTAELRYSITFRTVRERAGGRERQS